METREPDSAFPKTFVSYSWDDGAHKKWVKQLATRLRKDRVDVMLDAWHSKPGDQVPEFMERAIRENAFVIVVCTPRFKERLNERGGGVGYEGDIMTGYAFVKAGGKRFIPVLRRGSWSEAAPTWLLGRAYIDLSADPYSESEYRDLLRTLRGETEEAPPIGSGSDPRDETAEAIGETSRKVMPRRWLAVVSLSVILVVLVVVLYAAVRHRVKAPPTPVVLLVADDQLMGDLRLGLSNEVRLELKVFTKLWIVTRTIHNYKGEPIWVGVRDKPLAVTEATRQKYLSFTHFPEPRAIPGPAIELEPGMRLEIELYYPGPGPSPRRYLDPPQAAIVVRAPGPEPVQLEELHGP